MELQACPHCGELHDPAAETCPATGRLLNRSRLRGEWIFLGLLGLMILLAGVRMLIGHASQLAIPAMEQGELEVPKDLATDAGRSANPVDGPPAATPSLRFPSGDSNDIPGPEQTDASSLATSRAIATGETSTEIAVSTPSAIETSAASDVPRAWNACDGAPLSRLNTGMKAYVSFVPPLANRVRTEAGTHARILGHIQPGEEVAILDGPGCANGWVWWRVRSEVTGLTGWTAEGDIDNYWLIPEG